ncbi:MAG TPA: hypothetical protein VEW67_06070, partial [Thermoleophilaceae bacterium]|nr:hypothetical protein [Thermoleophilaceae bacterium]
MTLVPSQFLRALLLTAVIGAAIGLPAASATAADCPNAAIRDQQGAAAGGLPDCMALEMVSPPKKFVQAAEGVSVSADGSRAWFSTKGGLEGAPGMVDGFAGDPYVATRGADGWAVVPALFSGELIKGWSSGADMVRSYSPDFSRWVGFGASRSQLELGQARVFRSGLGGVFGPLSPLLVPVDPANRRLDNILDASFQGASADHSHVYFKPGHLDARYLEGDPSPSGGESHVYVAGLGGGGGPSVELLARDVDGKVWGERCGARVGGQADPGGGNWNGRDQGAVS